jgi:hypothetical protein
MRDEADLCLDEFVQPTVNEFLADERSKGDLRRPKLACIVVAGLVDYIHVARPSLRQGLDTRKYRDHLALQCRPYALMRDICDATKHMRLGRSNAKFRAIATMRSDFSMLTTENGRAITTEDGTPIAVESWVAVQTDNGKERVDRLVVKARILLKADASECQCRLNFPRKCRLKIPHFASALHR